MAATIFCFKTHELFVISSSCKSPITILASKSISLCKAISTGIVVFAFKQYLSLANNGLIFHSAVLF